MRSRGKSESRVGRGGDLILARGGLAGLPGEVRAEPPRGELAERGSRARRLMSHEQGPGWTPGRASMVDVPTTRPG